ncbi:MAG: serine kinase of the HPr protein regulates carbohydrate metabolism [Phycisphaerales bacterium]|jgi:hypothetical protein|nr:serine kinase of the HPr protein regulates carbohydrate metabolism [Phycisphaerales bacterium]
MGLTLYERLYQYRFRDLILSSSLELPELLRAEDTRPDLRVVEESGHELGTALEPCYRRWTLANGTAWATFHKTRGGAIRIHFPDIAEFITSPNGREIRIRRAAEISDETIRHLLLDQILPSAQCSARALVLHASAVATPLGAIAFAGASGRGKSTMAAGFMADGFPLVSDDSLLLEEKEGRISAQPSYPGLRLWEDAVAGLFDHHPPVSAVAHYTSKKRIACDGRRLEFCREPLPLLRVFFLAPADQSDNQGIGNSVKITLLPPREAFMELLAHAFRLQVHGPDGIRREFEALARLTAQPLFHRLHFRRDFGLLPQVREAILSSLTDQEPAASLISGTDV